MLKEAEEPTQTHNDFKPVFLAKPITEECCYRLLAFPRLT